MPGVSRGAAAGPIVGGVIVVAIVVALLGVALTADRVAVIRAQGWIARQIQDRGFPAKPHATIAGFPFLAQVAARRLDKVVIMAAGKNLRPVEVKRLDRTLHGDTGQRQDRLPVFRHRPGRASQGWRGWPGRQGSRCAPAAATG
jgi:LmeA-like phospholipid-binding